MKLFVLGSISLIFFYTEKKDWIQGGIMEVGGIERVGWG